MNNKSNKGFSAFEILVVLVLYASIFCIVACMVFNTTMKLKFKNLKYDAVAFEYNVKTYLTVNDSQGTKDRIYLKDIVAFDESYNISSPFDESKNCSIINSYVEMKDDTTYITLECDHYVLYQYDANKDKMPIYWISSPMLDKPKVKKGTFVDEVFVYNYKKNNHYVFPRFVMEDEFIQKYNEKEKKNVTSVEELTSYEFRKEYRIRKAVNLD